MWCSVNFRIGGDSVAKGLGLVFLGINCDAKIKGIFT
jgi:hypothetical protein